MTRSIIALLLCAISACGVCLAVTNARADSDKTTIDLERGRPEAALRYHRPRAVQHYNHDKTELDLAPPLAQPPTEAPRASQRPTTLTTPAPTAPSGKP